jgi:hypothetical protein
MSSIERPKYPAQFRRDIPVADASRAPAGSIGKHPHAVQCAKEALMVPEKPARIPENLREKRIDHTLLVRLSP